MYKSIHIQNFRGLTDLRIEDLGRVNLIVGANNVGKTSLLEALWLFQSPGNPGQTVDLARSRWFEQPRTGELLWHGLFRNLVTTQKIEISGNDCDGSTSTLELIHSPESAETGVANGSPWSSPELLRFRFDSSASDQTVDSLIALAGSDDVRGQFVDVANRSGILLPADHHLTAKVVADRYSDALDAGRKDLLIKSLQVLDSRLVDLSLRFDASEDRPIIRGHFRDTPVPLPINLMGGGITRLVEILVTFPQVEGGLLLIDEIDDGIYARSLTAAWQAIDTASHQANVQVFATTHSWECVSAAVEAFVHSPEDFRLHRLERHGEAIRAVTYDHEVALAAVTGHVEVR